MSQILSINLARRPFTNDLLMWMGVGILLVSTLGLSLWNSGQFLATGSQVREVNSRRQELQAERRAATRREGELIRTIEVARAELLASRATFANTIIQAHSFSWTRLFNELEKVMPLGVRLVNIRPRIDQGIRVRMNGVARNSQAFWELQENLERWPVFGNVYPDAVAPSASRAGVMAGELMVTLEAEYFPEARLRLGLSADDDPSLVDAAESPAASAQAAAVAAPAGGGETAAAPQQDAQIPAVAPQPAGEAPDAVVRRGRRGRRSQAASGPRGGVERQTPVPEGAPGLEKPDFNTAPRPDVEGFQRPNVQSVTEDGRMLDADGNEITLEDIINLPNGIQPGPARQPEEQPVDAQGSRRPGGNEVKGKRTDGTSGSADGGARSGDDEEKDR